MEVSGRVKSNRKNGKGDIFCQPCQGDGDKVHAEGFCITCNEYFCSSCLKVHRKQSATKNHVIKGKNKMPIGFVQTDPCLEYCKVHKTKVVKFFCEGHNSVGCGDCMVLEHKTCKVQLVSEMSGNYGDSGELKEIKQNIEELEKKINASKVEIKKSLKAADDIKAKVINEIKTFRREMDTYLDKVEAESIKEVEQINVKDVSQQRQLFDECVKMENELHEFRTKLVQCPGKINQLFVASKQVQTKLSTCQRSVDKIATESQIHVYKFDPCKDMNTLKLKSIPFGETTTEIQKFNIKTKTDIANMKTHYVKKLNVQAKNEPECFISGLAMLSPDEILLADYNNSSLKILNVRSNTITSVLQLPDQPWDVTVIFSETAAVTLQFEGIIMFVGTSNGLSEGHMIKVRRGCRGIDHRNGRIAVSYDSPKGVQILNIEGDILHEAKDTSIFQYPWYIAFSDDNTIVVSNSNGHGVHEFTINGNINATMKWEELRSPRGLTVTSNETVVVCCQFNSGRLSMIVPGTREIQQLSVQDVKQPGVFLVCEEDSLMYICDWGEVGSNIIKVFRLM